MEAEREGGDRRKLSLEEDVTLIMGDTTSMNKEIPTVVGKVLIDKPQKLGTIKGVLPMAWGIKKGLKIKDAGENMILFIFYEIEQMRRVIRDQLWIVARHMFVLQVWWPLLCFEDIHFDVCPFWVQLYGVKPVGMTMENILRMGGRVGSILAYEDSKEDGGIVRKFLHIRVKFLIEAPLVDGSWVSHPNSSRFWVSVRYEKLQNYCYKCGRLRHENLQCNFEQAWLARNPSKPKYRSGMGVLMLRSIAKVCWVANEGFQFEYSIDGMTARGKDGGDKHMGMDVEGGNL